MRNCIKNILHESDDLDWIRNTGGIEVVKQQIEDYHSVGKFKLLYFYPAISLELAEKTVFLQLKKIYPTYRIEAPRFGVIDHIEIYGSNNILCGNVEYLDHKSESEYVKELYSYYEDNKSLNPINGWDLFQLSKPNINESDDLDWIKNTSPILIKRNTPMKINLCDDDNFHYQDVTNKMIELYPTYADQIDNFMSGVFKSSSPRGGPVFYLEGPTWRERRDNGHAVFKFLDWDMCQDADESNDYEYILDYHEFMNVSFVDEPINESDDFDWIRDVEAPIGDVDYVDNFVFGANVVRGKDWIHNDTQDNYGRSVGRLLNLVELESEINYHSLMRDSFKEVSGDVWVPVGWDNGHVNLYRAGPNNYDLEYYVQPINESIELDWIRDEDPLSLIFNGYIFIDNDTDDPYLLDIQSLMNSYGYKWHGDKYPKTYNPKLEGDETEHFFAISTEDSRDSGIYQLGFYDEQDSRYYIEEKVDAIKKGKYYKASHIRKLIDKKSINESDELDWIKDESPKSVLDKIFSGNNNLFIENDIEDDHMMEIQKIMEPYGYEWNGGGIPWKPSPHIRFTAVVTDRNKIIWYYGSKGYEGDKEEAMKSPNPYYYTASYIMGLINSYK